MHINSLPAEAHQSTYVKLHNGHPAKSNRFEERRTEAGALTSSRPVGLPDEFDAYLTTTSTPHEIHVSLRDSRDRRIRLLLRRFTNQILYGCKNPYCDVASCLSYRKRHSTTPLRPFNEIAARALAWRCVEEHVDAGKCPPQNEQLVAKKKGKSKTSHETRSSLCWNEPVVPWYEDPSETHRRGRFTSQKEYLPPSRTKKEETLKNCEGLPVNRGEDGKTVNTLTNGQVSGLDRDLSDHVQVEGNSDGPENAQTLGDVASQIVASTHDHARVSVRPGVNAREQRHVSFLEPAHGQSEALTGRSKKDTSSFTQSLFDTESIKSLDSLKAQSNILTTKQSGQSNPNETALPYKTSSITAAPTGKITTVLPRVCTFRILPSSAIIWLRCTMPLKSEESRQLDGDAIVGHDPALDFARQSLHFCLSRPSRLLDSARLWHYSQRIPNNVHEDTYVDTIQTLLKHENEFTPSDSKTILPQPDAVTQSFALLIEMTSSSEVLGHLFSALQHAYILPLWLQRAHSKDALPLHRLRTTSGSRSASRSLDGALHRGQSRDRETESGFMSDDYVVELVLLITWALYYTVDQQMVMSRRHREASPLSDVGQQFDSGRSSGIVFPSATLNAAWSKDLDAKKKYQAYASLIDTMEDWSCLRLFDGIADLISHRLAISKTAKAGKSAGEGGSKKSGDILSMIIEQILKSMKQHSDNVASKLGLQRTLLVLSHSVLLRCWNRSAIVKKRGPVGGALELLAALYRSKNDLAISPSDFAWKFLAESFDEIEMPVQWTEFREDSTQTHILAYSFLFEPAVLVKYFRAINSITMKKAHESAASVYANARQFLLTVPTVYGAKEVLTEMRPHMARFFVLTIRRQNMLMDAIDQIWRRQRRELMRPLKVRLGKDEGEDGLDHGGVQQEFFRVVFAEALDPDYGMFTIDDRTRMTWFKPGSLEPLYKFEALGILMSLAVYNGITLPVTFPLAFYRKILGLKVKTLGHIEDGWPDLAKGLRQMLDWTEGDVGDIIARTYEFSYEAFGTPVSIDMTKVGRDDPWPPTTKHRKGKERIKTTSFDFTPIMSPTPPPEEDTNGQSSSSASRRRSVISTVSRDKISVTSPPSSTPSDQFSTPWSPKNTPLSFPPGSPTSSTPTSSDSVEAPLVTNATRHAYVADYIHWLATKSIHAQFASFLNGFLTCLSPMALSIFTPDHLKLLVEGTATVDIDGLQATTTYDEYSPSDPVIQWFWSVVRDMTPQQHRKLLEFVTASDRVPVNGVASVVFIVQRNGDSDDRLPSSSTCYGRLLLPAYSSRDVLRAKLEIAIEHSVGFGSL